MEKENKNNLSNYINNVIFVGEDISVYKSLKTLSENIGKYNLKSTTYNSKLLKVKDLVLLDDSTKNFKKRVSSLQKKNIKNFFLILNSGNIDLLEGKDYKAFLKPLRIFELNKEILKKIHSNNQSHKKWKLDRGKLKFYKTSNKSINLTEKEYNLLKYLLDNKDNVISKQKLLKEVWNYKVINSDSSSNIRVVETLVSKIRKKLSFVKDSPQIVKLKEGYQILI